MRMTASLSPQFEIVLRIPAERVAAVDRQVAGRTGAATAATDGASVLTRVTRVRGAVVLLARGGSGDAAELRFTLQRGAPAEVAALAHRWVVRHGLWFGGDSGHGGGSGNGDDTLVRAPRPRLHATMSIDAAVREMVRVCLVQIIGNAAVVASTDEGAARHEHVHQARVGIRKLRTVLGELGPAVAGLDASLETRLAEMFGQLGAARDREVVLARWASELSAAGAPGVVFPQPEELGAVEVIRGRRFTGLMLDLMVYATGSPADAEPSGDDLLVIAVERLDHLHHRVVSQCRQFAELDAAERHRLRRQLKRLRYLTELCAPLMKQKRVKRFLAAVTPAQDALGSLNDLALATSTYRSLLDGQPQAWFALGWLAAHGVDAAERCVESLLPLAEAKRPWRGLATRRDEARQEGGDV